MSDPKDQSKKSIFSKVLEAGESFLDAQIRKSQAQTNAKSEDDENDFYFKSITEDTSYQINSSGFKEKPNRVQPSHLKQMSLKDSIVAGVIQTRQSQVSNFSRLVKSEQEKGWMIILKNEDEQLRKIKEELLKDQTNNKKSESITKADNPMGDTEAGSETPNADDVSDEVKDSDGADDDQAEEFNWELERQAREKLEDKIRERRKKLQEFITNCGELENRSFETKKWNMDSFLRALVRDTYTYDLIATEVVPDAVGNPHHYMPVDGSTIRFASPSLKRYKAFPESQTTVDFLYPEKQLLAFEKTHALELNETLLEEELYKYVQIIKGRIERAYTEEELKVGIRNINTDIYNNGYGIPELELLTSIVSSHLNTEYYNKAYFTQGFSAKGILHLKAPIPRRKLETIRQQWHHMIKGAKNSFQTPIFAGMDEINWIPLTQNHSDIEFQGWMTYLIKVISMIFQIDPKELGMSGKDDNSKGLGNDTEERFDQSKDKGLYPLLRFFESYINRNILDTLDPDFELKFTGYDDQTQKTSLERQEKEVKFKKTVNEIRSEDGLPPLPGMDNIILDPTYLQWYVQFSKEGQALAKKTQDQQLKAQQALQPPREEEPKGDGNSEPVTDEQANQLLNPDQQPKPEETMKSMKIEYFTLSK